MRRISRRVIGPVPVASVFMFATVGPAALTFLVRTFVADRVSQGPLRVAGGIVLSGVLTTMAVLVTGIPGIVAGMIGGDPNTTAQTVVMMLFVAAFAVTALVVLPAEWRRNRVSGDPGDDTARRYAVPAGGVYLLVFAILWSTEIPGLLSDSVDDRLAGDLPYTLVCFVLSIAIVAAVATGGRVGVAGGLESEKEKV